MNKQQQRVLLASILAGVLYAAPSAMAHTRESQPSDFEVIGGPLAAFKTVDGRLDIIETDQVGARALTNLGYGVETITMSGPIDAFDAPHRTGNDDPLQEITAPAPANVPADGAKVAVIDSGVNVNHPWLVGHIAEVGDLTGVMQDPWGNATQNPGSDELWFDGNGHGTHVAGIVRQNYPNVRIVVAKALNNRGQANSPWIARAITWSIDMNVDVINLSLGETGNSLMIREAVNLALSKGVIIVAAAGNWGHDGSPRFYPAALPGVVAVASTDGFGNVSYFSNRGDYVDIAAEGSEIVSAGHDGGLKKLSGTSMAAPKVAAIMAEIRHRHRDWSAQQVIDHVLGTSTDAGPNGPDGAYGHGIVDAQKARDTLLRQTPTGSVTLPKTTFVLKVKGRKISVSEPNGQVDILRVYRLDGRFEMVAGVPLNYDLGCWCFTVNDPIWTVVDISVGDKLVLRAIGPYGIPYQPVIIEIRAGKKPKIVKDGLRHS